MDNLVEKLTDLFFPKRCVGCGQVGNFLCEECLLTVKPLEAALCSECTRPSIGGFTHSLCLRPWSSERLLCFFKYEGVTKELIGQLKYGGVRQIANFLTEIIVQFLGEAAVSFGSQSLIVPVPLHPVKRLERGFNQTEILAESLGKVLAVKVSTGVLVKLVDNPSQTLYKLKERGKNVKGVFGVEKERKILLKNRDVVIVDDVFTSGATMRECARMVKRAGARFVYLLAVAKD